MRALVIGTFIVTLLGSTSGRSQNVVLVAVKASDDPTHIYPSSKLYIASITNRSNTKLVLEAVQMPGGYVGSGVFFPCSVEKWNSTSKAWEVIHRTELTQFINPSVTELEFKRGGERAVCRSLLPKEGARNGECVRFRISSKFGNGGEVLLSEPFIVDGKSDAVLTCNAGTAGPDAKRGTNWVPHASGLRVGVLVL